MDLLDIGQYNRVVDLVLDYRDCFVSPDGKVGFTNRVKHKINTGEAVPVTDRGRWKSYEEMKYISEQMRHLEEDGQIWNSMSSWTTQVVLADKKDGTKCLCIDYHLLYDLTTKDAYPLPRIEKCLDALNSSQFSLIDR